MAAAQVDVNAWDPITQPQDYAKIAGAMTPGVCEIIGAGDPRAWDKRKGMGISGAFSVFTGQDLAQFTVRLTLYTVEDWAAWHKFRPIIAKVPRRRIGKGKDSGVLSIQHPITQEVGISSIVIENLGAPEQVDHGVWAIDIKVMEWRQPKVALAAPEGAADQPVDPIEEDVIKPLTSQFMSLANDTPPAGPPPLPEAP
jgi:hypothetical protein